MAQTGNNERSANRVAVDVGATGTKSASKGAVLILVLCVLAAVWALAMMTAPGRIAYYYFFIYAEFYMGVIALVSLSITIMIGLLATDRMVLSIRQRVFLQSTHRTTGLMAVSGLFLHIWTKMAESSISIIDVFIPFLYQGTARLYVGLGTISGYVMLAVMWSGIARATFIGRGKPWMWRGIHAVSYLMWPLALLHGLSAGRPAATWVNVSYILCVLLVLVALAVRLSVSLNRKKDFSSTAGTGGMKPVGSMVPTISPVMNAMKRPQRREEPEPERLGPVAVVDTFQPAGSAIGQRPDRPRRLPPPEQDLVSPASGQRRETPEDRYDEQTRTSLRGRDDEIEYDEPAPRGRRSAIDDTSTRMRRVEMDDTSTRMRRTEMDDTPTRSFQPDFDEPEPREHRYADDDEPAPRARRRDAEPVHDEVPRGRRRVEQDDGDDLPRQRGRYEDERPGRRNSRFEPRYGSEVEQAPGPPRDRGVGNEGVDVPTLVDMAARRERRATQQETSAGVQAGRGARRDGRRGRWNDEVADDQYRVELRGEAN